MSKINFSLLIDLSLSMRGSNNKKEPKRQNFSECLKASKKRFRSNIQTNRKIMEIDCGGIRRWRCARAAFKSKITSSRGWSIPAIVLFLSFSITITNSMISEAGKQRESELNCLFFLTWIFWAVSSMNGMEWIFWVLPGSKKIK